MPPSSTGSGGLLVQSVLLLLVAAGIGWYASSRLNRRFWVWSGLSLLITPILTIIVLAVKGTYRSEAEVQSSP